MDSTSEKKRTQTLELRISRNSMYSTCIYAHDDAFYSVKLRTQKQNTISRYAIGYVCNCLYLFSYVYLLKVQARCLEHTPQTSELSV